MYNQAINNLIVGVRGLEPPKTETSDLPKVLGIFRYAELEY